MRFGKHHPCGAPRRPRKREPESDGSYWLGEIGNTRLRDQRMPLFQVPSHRLTFHPLQPTRGPYKKDQFSGFGLCPELSASVTGNNTGFQNLLNSVGRCSV
jgi:hypothetical protein